MTTTTEHSPQLERIRSRYDGTVIYVRGACACGWRASDYKPTRTTEGWALGERDAHEHVAAKTRETDMRDLENLRFRTYSTGKVHRADVTVLAETGRVLHVRPLCCPNSGAWVRGNETDAPVTCTKCGDGPSFVNEWEG